MYVLTTALCLTLITLEPMQGMSEDEGEDEEEIKIDQEQQAAARKVRLEREEKLRKMMEEGEYLSRYGTHCH